MSLNFGQEIIFVKNIFPIKLQNNVALEDIGKIRR